MKCKLNLRNAADVACLVNTLRELAALSKASTSFASKVAAMTEIEQVRLACQIREMTQMLWPTLKAECEIEFAFEST